MKLLRVCCKCGFSTKKVRSGYHHEQWWFPLFSTTDAILTDIACTLPRDLRHRITQLSVDLLQAVSHDDRAAMQEAGERVDILTKEIHEDFIIREREALTATYGGRADCVFDPAEGTTFPCPQCGSESLILSQVPVVAVCTSECGREYAWSDSKDPGCPECGRRPHAFRTEIEERYAGQPRTICSCRCSSTLDCASHVDGFCPKCGGLPTSYSIAGTAFCGKHHEPLHLYTVPKEFLFIETESLYAADLFPNAKFWGDAKEVTDGFPESYCQTCEAEHQRWRRE